MSDKPDPVVEGSSSALESPKSENPSPPAGGPAPPAKDPHDLIKRADVEKALLAEQGASAKLKEFTIKDFTTKGDNYACVVSSVEVQFERDGNIEETTFVVKLNPCRSGGFEKMTEIMFEKEIGFYQQILPLINNELSKINQPHLQVPTCYHAVETAFEQVIFLNDLRKLGYKMFDRKQSMDPAHVHLVLRELARMHAASVLLLSNEEFRGVDFVEKFPVLREFTEAMKDDGSDSNMDAMIDQYCENSAKIVDKNAGYEHVAQFMRSLKGKGEEAFLHLYQSKDPFRVICHGDCWNNNFLFRYGQDGAPVDCRLLDLQVVRVGSPALDLNYMLYCSLNGDVRTKNLTNIFNTYYASFASIMALAGQPLKFTVDELTQEFYAKNLFGLFMGMMLIPIVLMDSEDAPSFDDFKGDDMQKSMEQFQEKMMDTVQKNPLLTPRFLSMFDEMNESGLFKKKVVSEVTKAMDAVTV